MTRILHIPSGTFATFLSSIEYDNTHPNDTTEDVVDYENSYDACHNLSIESKLNNIVLGLSRFNHHSHELIAEHILEEELEIIYD